MSRTRTTQEAEFLKYFRQIDKRGIDTVLSGYRSTGPVGYANSLRQSARAVTEGKG